jgi:hypothetical protein
MQKNALQNKNVTGFGQKIPSVLPKACCPQYTHIMRIVGDITFLPGLFFSFVLGDNILTAITIGRNCRMINEMDEVVRVTANRLHGNSDVVVTYTKVEPRMRRVSFKLLENAAECQKYDLEAHNEIKKCHFAMDGNTFAFIRTHDPELLEKVGCAVNRISRIAYGSKGTYHTINSKSRNFGVRVSLIHSW